MRNRTPRLLVLLLSLLFLFNLPSFLAHAQYFLSGAVSDAVITGNWVLVAVNIVLFLSVLLFLRVRKLRDWSGTVGISVYTAFIVSLFVEMYGVPLTIFLGGGIVTAPGTPPDPIFSIGVPGAMLALNQWMVVGVATTVLGMILVATGWYQVYAADGLVTDGLYRYSRNPQYLGIILIGLGWVVGWPTLLTLTLFPVLAAAYRHAARDEAEAMRERYGDRYHLYAQEVPLLL